MLIGAKICGLKYSAYVVRSYKPCRPVGIYVYIYIILRFLEKLKNRYFLCFAFRPNVNALCYDNWHHLLIFPTSNGLKIYTDSAQEQSAKKSGKNSFP